MLYKLLCPALSFLWHTQVGKIGFIDFYKHNTIARNHHHKDLCEYSKESNRFGQTWFSNTLKLIVSNPANCLNNYKPTVHRFPFVLPHHGLFFWLFAYSLTNHVMVLNTQHKQVCMCVCVMNLMFIHVGERRSMC